MRFGKLYTVVLFLLSTSTIFGQEVDQKEFDLLKQLEVFSKEETPLFTFLLQENRDANLQDYLKLMILSGAPTPQASFVQYNTKINDFLTKGNFADKKQLSTSKSVKRFYKEVHDGFFTQYSENPGFTRIFEDGGYNCATASALYAYLLDSLDINYQIMETPTHVYIIARPDRESIIFETTTPAATVIQFNDRMKTQYVEYLYSNKQISKEEWLNEDKNTLFNKYFYRDNEITLRQLTGLLYYNQGISSYQSEQYLKAWKFFEKAYILYPEQKIRYLINASLGNFLLKITALSEEELFPYYLRFSQIGKQEYVQELMTDFIKNVSKKYLFQYPDLPKYHSFFSRAIATIEDSTLRNELNYQNLYDLGYYFYLKSSYDSSLSYLSISYKKNSSDLIVQNLITNIIGRSAYSLGNETEILDYLEKNFHDYPFLENENQLKDYYLLSLSVAVGKKYDLEKEKEGSPYLAKLKTYLQQKPSISSKVKPVLVVAIGEVSGFYVRRQDYKSAKDLLELANKAIPGDEEITRRLEHVTKMLKK